MHWPLTARLASAFLSHGATVSALCPPGHPLRFVRGIHRTLAYSATRSLSSLRRALETIRPDLVVPGDDGVVWQLHALHATYPGLRSLIEASLGNPAFYSTIRHRFDVLQTAEKLGIRIPGTQHIRSQDDLARMTFQEKKVLKIDGTWGGNGVSIVSNSDHAVSEFQRLSRPVSAPFAIKRRIINYETLALWIWRSGPQHQTLVQDFIRGYPANAMMACWKGVVQQILIVRVLASQGVTGAALVVEVIEHEEIKRTATVLAKAFELTGFHGLDFMVDESSGKSYLIELNPRCTQLGHIRSGSQSDLTEALLRGWADVAGIPEEKTQLGQIIAFYPQALRWAQEDSEFLTHLDVPDTEPELTAELVRPSWPERRLLNRMYEVFLGAIRRMKHRSQ